ncbi:Hypothetical predicted protein [Pelobates cultripes]|uniref:Uncharacterized protein n=1 Tax=Pelobates cultripes TaxID=61616 RepID=A0AAD1RVA2_PELCU|nr:Hypothetical predicted protein [Pelobates cultripes]
MAPAVRTVDTVSEFTSCIAYKRKKKLNGVNIPNAAILAAYLVFVSLCVSVRTDWWEAARYDGTGSAMPVEDPEV